jgi:hypothetical protein
MTLVELLVVVAILGALLAISIPMLKPMLESRKTSNAAQVLAGALQHARTKAIQERRHYGIWILPYETAPTVSVQLRYQKGVPPDANFVNPPHVRVRVVDGDIIFYRFYPDVFTLGETPEWHTYENLILSLSDPERDKLIAERYDVHQHFQVGNKIQFNRLGRSFTIGDNFALDAPYDNLNLPEDDEGSDAMEYRITRQAVDSSRAWLPPVVMPRGTVVDLVFSGGDGEISGTDRIPMSFPSGSAVFVVFSPMGNVDSVQIAGNPDPYKVNETLYFCVGDWDRQIDTASGKTFAEDGKTFAEDGKSNLETPASYWVTLHPKTGGVRIAENAPIKPETNAMPENNDAETNAKAKAKLRDARRFAREHYFNVGGN